MTSDALRHLVDRGVLAHYISAQQMRDRAAGARWSIDLDAQRLRFETAGAQLELRAHLMGLRRREPGEWMWAWNNVNNLPAASIALAERVKSLAKRHGFREGLDPELALSNDLTAERLVIAAKALLGTRMSLELPVSAELAATVFLGDEGDISDPTVPQIHKAVLRAARSGIMVDHRSGIRALEGFRGLTVAEHGPALLIEALGGALAVEFDDLGRVSRLRRLVKKAPAAPAPAAPQAILGEASEAAPSSPWTIAHAWTMASAAALAAEAPAAAVEEGTPVPPKALLGSGETEAAPEASSTPAAAPAPEAASAAAPAAASAVAPADAPAVSQPDAEQPPAVANETGAFPSRRELREHAAEAPALAPVQPVTKVPQPADDELDAAWNGDAMGETAPNAAPPQSLLMGGAAAAGAAAGAALAAPHGEPAAAPQQCGGWSFTQDNPNETSVVPRLGWGRSPFGDVPAEEAPTVQPVSEQAPEAPTRPAEPVAAEATTVADAATHGEAAPTVDTGAHAAQDEAAKPEPNEDAPEVDDEYSSGMTLFPPIDTGSFGATSTAAREAESDVETGPTQVVSQQSTNGQNGLAGAPEAPQFGSPAPQFGSPAPQFGQQPAPQSPNVGGSQPPSQYQQPPMPRGPQQGSGPVGPGNAPFSPRRDGGIPPVPPAPQSGQPVWGGPGYGVPQNQPQQRPPYGPPHGQQPFGGAPQQRPLYGPPQGQPPHGQPPQDPNGQPPQVWPPQGPNGQPPQQGPWNQR